MENTNQQPINTTPKDKPTIGITIGDFNGIGPEIILKLLEDNRINRICTPVVYGSNRILNKYRKMLDLEDLGLQIIKGNEPFNTKKANVVNCWEDDLEPTPGKSTPEAGKCAFLALQGAVQDLKAGRIDAVVTAPINKANMPKDEFPFPGHTEYFAAMFEAKDNLMLLVDGGLRVAVVTGHVALGSVPQKVNKGSISSKINLLNKSLKLDFGINKPRIAVLGLNPHAGEAGMLGQEEQQIIVPLINDLKSKHILAFGPYPADGFFGTHLYKKFDAVLAMYHDQGLIPFKTLAFESGVNFTAGLSVVRTSPDHGTAYDIAGKNKADETSIRQALYVACDAVKSRKTAAELEANALKHK